MLDSYPAKIEEPKQWMSCCCCCYYKAVVDDIRYYNVVLIVAVFAVDSIHYCRKFSFAGLGCLDCSLGISVISGPGNSLKDRTMTMNLYELHAFAVGNHPHRIYYHYLCLLCTGCLDLSLYLLLFFFEIGARKARLNADMETLFLVVSFLAKKQEVSWSSCRSCRHFWQNLWP